MLVGQERAEAALARALQQGRVSHAYLFVGPESVGKNTAALLFAQALNCERSELFNTETRRHGAGFGPPEPGDAATDPGSSGEQRVLCPPPVSSVSPCLRVDPLTACGACNSCRRIVAGTHPDVHVITPGSKGGQ